MLLALTRMLLGGHPTLQRRPLLLARVISSLSPSSLSLLSLLAALCASMGDTRA